MDVITDIATPPWPGERSVVTIGAYDGVHVGHQAVIALVRALAAELADRSVVLTFDRHPATVVRPESAPPILTDEGQRLELLAATGIDAAVVLPFDTRQASEPPESFIERVLVHGTAGQGRRGRRATSTSVTTAPATSTCSRSSAAPTTSRFARSTWWCAPTGSTSP